MLACFAAAVDAAAFPWGQTDRNMHFGFLIGRNDRALASQRVLSSLSLSLSLFGLLCLMTQEESSKHSFTALTGPLALSVAPRASHRAQ